jgi:DNA-binding Xre family transcriptional regulator
VLMMLDKGLSLKDITDISGLSVEEIEMLKNENGSL